MNERSRKSYEFEELWEERTREIDGTRVIEVEDGSKCSRFLIDGSQLQNAHFSFARIV